MSTIEDKRIRWLVSVAQQHACLKPPVLLILFVGMVTVDAMTWIQCVTDSSEGDGEEAQMDCSSEINSITNPRRLRSNLRYLARCGMHAEGTAALLHGAFSYATLFSRNYSGEIRKGQLLSGVVKRLGLCCSAIDPRNRGKPAEARESPVWLCTFWYSPGG